MSFVMIFGVCLYVLGALFMLGALIKDMLDKDYLSNDISSILIFFIGSLWCIIGMVLIFSESAEILVAS